MLLMPDPNTANIDPFFGEPTLILTCDVVEPADGKPYERDPRSLAKRAEAYLKSTGLGDTAYFGPEPEFFIFDGVRWQVDMSGCFVQDRVRRSALEHRQGITKAATWATARRSRAATSRFRRSTACRTCAPRCAWCSSSMGIPVEVHHHEVARRRPDARSAPSSARLVQRADWMQMLKYVVHNVAALLRQDRDLHAQARSSATTARGMHVHQSVWKDGKNLFAGDGYAGLSEFALYYIGGIIKHARALNAITNPGTNSYKRLVPGFEAPVKLAYSAKNRSASIRIPYVANPKGRRIEVRFPDPTGQPLPGLSRRC